jgi:hypothetical protein
MHHFFSLLLTSFILLVNTDTVHFQNEKIRNIEYGGKTVRTTFGVPQKFIGKYSGRKGGYMEFRADGTGSYQYDYNAFPLKGCKEGSIEFEWGFMIDEKQEIISYKREYGTSYPVLLRSISNPSFKGCREEILVDFIMEFKSGELQVSSSDDWSKQKN